MPDDVESPAADHDDEIPTPPLLVKLAGYRGRWASSATLTRICSPATSDPQIRTSDSFWSSPHPSFRDILDVLPMLDDVESPAADHGDEIPTPPLLVKLTGYRLLVIATTVALGVVKLVLTKRRESSALTWLDFATAAFMALILWWLGLYEDLPVASWFFDRDYAPHIAHAFVIEASFLLWCTPLVCAWIILYTSIFPVIDSLPYLGVFFSQFWVRELIAVLCGAMLNPSIYVIMDFLVSKFPWPSHLRGLPRYWITNTPRFVAIIIFGSQLLLLWIATAYFILFNK